MEIHRIVVAFGLLGVLSAPLAQEVTGNFSGIVISSYDNEHPGPPTSFNGATLSGTFAFDGSQMNNTGFGFYAGTGFLLTFDVFGQSLAAGGIGPMAFDGSFFTPSVSAGGQEVALQAGQDFASTLSLAGLPNAFGPDGNLTPTTFAPGAAILGDSFAQFGNREIGATLVLTSLTMSQGPVTVSVSAVPEPSTNVMLLAGMALAVWTALRHSKESVRSRTVNA